MVDYTVKTIINNEERNMKDALRSLLLNNKYVELCIATAYWDIPGLDCITAELRQFITRGGKLRLLIGEEPRVYSGQLASPTEFKHKEIVRRHSVDEIKVREAYAGAIQLLRRYMGESAPIEVRFLDREKTGRFLHAKCYIILESLEDEKGIGIIGSSNFTQKGLEDNSELNYLENEPHIVTNQSAKNFGHQKWFNDIWQLGEDWSKEFLEYLELHIQSLPPAGIDDEIPGVSAEPEEPAPLTPYELYIKLLQINYGNIVDKELRDTFVGYLPKTPKPYSLLDYQIDAAIQCYFMMKEHGGFMLADVVGLGKTIVGTLLIKHFLTFPDADLQVREKKVLIVTPPAIKSSWIKTLNDFFTQEFIKEHIAFITTGSISKLTEVVEKDVNTEEIEESELDIEVDVITDSDSDAADTGEFTTELIHENYGLIIIDESHKFRNGDKTKMYRDLNELIGNITKQTAHQPYIGLLSATPQNNAPEDIKNQIYLFERTPEASTLTKVENSDLDSFFHRLTDKYRSLRNASPSEIKSSLEYISGEIRDKILADIMVRRTRTDIKKLYDENWKFPHIQGPITLKYELENELAKLFIHTSAIIGHKRNGGEEKQDVLYYYRYRAIEYLKNEADRKFHKGRGNRDVTAVAEQLAFMMQMNMVKRLESSFTAFRKLLHNLERYTANMIRMWDENCIFICPNININKELEPLQDNVSFEDCAENIRKKIQKKIEEGKLSNREYTQDAFRPEYRALLVEDHNLLTNLCAQWDKFKYDPKLNEFLAKIDYMLGYKNNVLNHVDNPSHQLVIFTEAIDTAEKLTEELRKREYRVLCITAQERDKLEKQIRENFDANHDEKEQKNNYDILITTDVLAEGVNLHRSNAILNYDTPWNATKLMQRIGRVNRIGSKAENVYVFNFMPSAKGNEHLHLVEKCYQKLQSFHILFGEDSKIFNDNEEVYNYATNDVDNIIKLVEGDESQWLKYLAELRRYKQEHTARYFEIENAETDLQLGVKAEDEYNLFVIKSGDKVFYLENNPNTQTIDGSSHFRKISTLDMFNHFCELKNVSKEKLTTNWNKIRELAELYINQDIYGGRHLNNAQAKNKARKALNEWNNAGAMDEDLLIDLIELVNINHKMVITKINSLYADQQKKQIDPIHFLNSVEKQATIAALRSEVKNAKNLLQQPEAAKTYIGLEKQQ